MVDAAAETAPAIKTAAIRRKDNPWPAFLFILMFPLRNEYSSVRRNRGAGRNPAVQTQPVFDQSRPSGEGRITLRQCPAIWMLEGRLRSFSCWIRRSHALKS